MTLLEAVVLGIVQGLTEFLPISSSAHLVLVPELLGWGNPSLDYIVVVHAATLLSLLIYFRRELAGLVRPPPGQSRPYLLAILLALGTAPAAVIGYLFEERFEKQFDRPFDVALQLMATGALLIVAEIVARTRRRHTGPLPGAAAAVGIGFGQALSIVPGISRSGATITAGLLAGLNREQAAQFSFLLAIPIIAGATIAKTGDVASSGMGIAAAAGGFLSSFVAGYAAIAGMIGYLKRRGLGPFAAYCLIAGALCAALLK